MGWVDPEVKSEGMEPLVVRSSHLGKDDLVWKRNTNRFPLFRVLIERSEIEVYDKVREVSMVFYLCVVSVHSGRLRT